MTVPVPRPDLDDTDGLLAVDRAGALRSAAMAGAQVRAVSTAIEEGVLGRLRGMQPRAITFVDSGAAASRAMALVEATVGAASRYPLSRVRATPARVGPLDVVVVAGDDPGDPLAAESIHAAVRRGAEVVVVAPLDGPLRDAGAGRALELPPRIPVAPRNRMIGHVAAILGVLAVLDAGPVDIDLLARTADALDAEALSGQPSADVTVNPAKQLAARLANRRFVLVGGDPAAIEVAGHGCAVILSATGIAGASAELPEVLAAVHEHRAIGSTGALSDVDALFHDEELDGPLPTEADRLILIDTTGDPHLLRRRAASLGEPDLVAVDDAVDLPLQRALLIAERFDMAAAYLRLTGG
ncbi:hypothetical protein [Millisia brevis]|uniref:hypothetical protein n=1 Tax=Millisia brevis TaxID=264148 RepID=UPI000834243C|nr:hypothetical protein [Millisia brevis]